MLRHLIMKPPYLCFVGLTSQLRSVSIGISSTQTSGLLMKPPQHRLGGLSINMDPWPTAAAAAADSAAAATADSAAAAAAAPVLIHSCIIY